MNNSLLNLDPLDPAITECPFDYYQALREEGGVFRVPDRNFFLVSRYDLVVKVVKDTDTFSSKTGVQVPSAADGSHRPSEGVVRTLLTADPPEHRLYRSLVNKAFSLKRVSSWESRIRMIADELIDDFTARGSCEVNYDFAVPMPLIVIIEALGLPLDMLRQFKTWSDTISHLGGMLSEQEMVRVQALRRDFSAWVDDIIAERKLNLGDDFISDLIRARFKDKRPLDDAELNSIVLQFLVAGNETTTNTITSGMLLLLQHPGQMKLVQEDRSLIPNLVEEVLRIESPVQTHFRYATKATELNGVKIPEGAGVGVMYGCANRDKAHFSHPETFDVQRKNSSRHLSFSQGIHFCPGAPLARLESVIAFEQLFKRLQNFQLDQSASDLRHLPSFTHRGLRKVQISFDRRVTARTG
ncbi:cytochrome P450 [Gammaproteobacteria bacterium]|nr:cytochrome P450 [Gammaproteobacteria bacterium]